MKGMRSQKGWLLISAMAALLIFSWLILSSMKERAEVLNSQIDAQQGARIATVVNAIQQAILEPNALSEYNLPTGRFRDGRVLIGTGWLKSNACSGGSAPKSYIDCTFENRPSLGDNSAYRAEIANDGIEINVILHVGELNSATNTIATGFFIDGSNYQYRSCRVARNAESSSKQIDSQVAEYRCNPDNGLIEVDVTRLAGASNYIHRGGLNSPTAEINWGGQNLKNVNELEANQGTITSLITDALTADTATITTATITNGTIDTLTSSNGSIDTLTSSNGTIDDLNSTTANIANGNVSELNVSGGINQTDASRWNTIAGGMRIGTGAEMLEIGGGSIYTDGAFVDSTDNSYFVSPKEVSRLKDVRLTSRGGVRVSTLLPNYVNKGAVMINGFAQIRKPNCADGVGYDGARVVLSFQDTTMGISDNGTVRSEIAKIRPDVQSVTLSGDPAWLIRLYMWSVKDWSWQICDGPCNTSTSNDNAYLKAIANIYCYYP